MKKNFTLVELLVVIAIISILSAALYGGTIYAMQVARRQACRGQLRGVGVAAQSYEAENQGKQMIISDRAQAAISYQRFIYLGMIDNAKTLLCPECLHDGEGRDGTYVQSDFQTGSGTNITENWKTLKSGFGAAEDYSFANKRIPATNVSTAPLAADGYREADAGNEYEGHNHLNYGSVLHKAGDVIPIAEPRWWLKCGGQDMLSSADTGISLSAASGS